MIFFILITCSLVKSSFKNLEDWQINNLILGLDKNDKDINKRIEKFNELDVEFWYKYSHKEIMSRIKRAIPSVWKKYLETLSITTFITEDGCIKHIIAPQGKTTSFYPSKITKLIQQKFGNDDIIIAETPTKRNFIAPDLFRSRENHAEVKIFENLVNQKIAKNSKIYLVANKRTCITCKIVGEQFKILSQIEGNDVTIEVYSGEGQDSTWLEDWEENDKENFKSIYREFFEDLLNKYPTLELNIEEQLDRLWRIYGYKDPMERILNGNIKI
jgi:hypothetical protein